MMDTSYLSQQVNTIIGQLHGLFDEIGVPSHDRETREAEVFAALSETLNGQLRKVTTEKNEMIDKAEKMVTTIRQMEESLDDRKARRNYRESTEDDDLQVTFPLTRCLQVLKEKQGHISRLHRERYEQVKKLVEALESYSSHLEPTFVKIPLPPSGANQAVPPNFDLSPTYVDKLDAEFTRVYEEYVRRVGMIKAMSEQIISLWAELGTPQAQTDAGIVKYYRDSPEQLGLHEADLARLRSKRDRLSDEKKNREKRLQSLRSAVDTLWAKLGIDESETKAFLNANRGCGIRQINEFEDELARLNDLKHQNLHLFVEDARCKLQELWDTLYFSEDEMLEFTPAFSDVYSDALLEAHEREISRLEALKEQRAPTLALVDRHRTLVHDRDELAASSQDASRLMMRGQKGEKRDPTRLLREEKMRKRIAKELPKIAVELKKLLENWEDEWGRPFLVHGESYLDIIEASENKSKGGPRSKTPAGPPAATKAAPKSASHNRTQSTTKNVPNRNGAKTPVAGSITNGGTLKRNAAPPKSGAASPTRLPTRAPLSNMKTGSNSPTRPRAATAAAETSNSSRDRHPHIMRAPPPKMRDLGRVPELEAPANNYRNVGLNASTIVRQVEPEDVYVDRPMSRQQPDRPMSRQQAAGAYAHSRSQSQFARHPDVKVHVNAKEQDFNSQDSAYHSQDSYSDTYSRPMSRNASDLQSNSSRGGHIGRDMAGSGSCRQISNTSTNISGSENWETYDDNSEPEPDASDAYYAKLRAAMGRDHARPATAGGHYSSVHGGSTKRVRGVPPQNMQQQLVMIDDNGNRIVSGSEWTDEDAF
ncbi:hypothetical protein MKZ38_004464 [Zalerion maritima]|uniref:Anaphase spindle elongation protein 1 n=1 Tax=Zalerion maritima TaxID=339359 RepID=A0AAD5RWI1_9PEZI|nr:hypothetical protein MKZ38_004464 [Zalerion maritima]